MNSSGLNDEDAHLFRNNKATREAIPYAFKTVLNWGCQKQPSETYKEFITNKGVNLKSFKFTKRDLTKLDKTHPNDYDVTFLHSLIPAVCDNIALSGTQEWETRSKDKNSVEFLLKQAKDARNDVAHDLALAVSPTLFDSMKISLNNLLEVAGILYGVLHDEVDKEQQHLRSVFSTIQSTVLDEKGRVEHIAQKLATFGRSEIAEVWKSKRRKEALPLSPIPELNRTSIFHPIEVSHPNKRDPTQRNIYSCKEIFGKVKENFKIVQGVPGSGKTTLLRVLVEKWLGVGQGNWSFQGLDNFDLLLFIECRTISCNSFAEVLKLNFPKTLLSFNDNEIVAAASHLKILIVIDGYDELNVNAKLLVSSIMDTYVTHNNRSFIVSSRPHAASDLSEDLTDRGITFEILSIEPIVSMTDKVNFLLKFEEEMLDVKSPDLVEAFKSLPSEVVHVFSHPVYLTLFCVLFRADEVSVSEWKSERSILAAVYELVKKKIGSRIKFDLILNDRVHREKLMRALCKFSLELIDNMNFFVNGDHFTRFCEECCNLVCAEIDYASVLSCIFSTEQSLNSNQETTYHFFHASFQEYLAARHIAFILMSESKYRKLDSGTEKRNLIQNIIERTSKDAVSPQYLQRLVIIWQRTV